MSRVHLRWYDLTRHYETVNNKILTDYGSSRLRLGREDDHLFAFSLYSGAAVRPSTGRTTSFSHFRLTTAPRLPGVTEIEVARIVEHWMTGSLPIHLEDAIAEHDEVLGLAAQIVSAHVRRTLSPRISYQG